MPKVMLTVRSEGLRRHGGQISFPGGRIEPNETAEQAALRELFEETGVGPEKVDVLGTLTPLYIPNSNSGVTPIVSVITEPMQYVPSEAEVEEIFTVDLAMFMLQANLGSITKEYSGTQVIWPVWNVHAHVPLWGATAMILNELIWLLRGDTDV